MKPDFNRVGDGVINVSDLLDLLAAFGSTDAASDVDGNGRVNVSDLLDILSMFGTSCSTTTPAACPDGQICPVGDAVMSPLGELSLHCNMIEMSYWIYFC